MNPLVTIRLDAKSAVLKHDGRHKKALLRVPLVRPKAAPILKWAGGKQWLAPMATSLLPENFKGTYREPCLGGGAFFFALGPHKAVLSDINSDLIDTYEAIKTDVDSVIKVLGHHTYDSDHYYQARDAAPRTRHTRAARIIYLNRTCWNGLYRVNSKGHFNVPFGRYSNPTICDAERLRAASELLQSATLCHHDFGKSTKKAVKGDLVYLDPPYITGHTNNGFLKYNAHLFSWQDQKRLAEVAVSLRAKGVHVLVSNANHGRVAACYPGFYRYRLVRNSLIGGNGSTRGHVFEMLLASYPLFGVRSEVI